MYTTSSCNGIWYTDVRSSSLVKFLSDKSQPDIQVNMYVYHVTADRSIYDVQKPLESRENKFNPVIIEGFQSLSTGRQEVLIVVNHSSQPLSWVQGKSIAYPNQ